MRSSKRQTKLSRIAINTLCDNVLPVPSLDPYASHYSTVNVRERLRDQLVKIEMVNTKPAIEALTNYISKRQGLAYVKDDTNVGLPASEAASGSIAQASQSLFKATGQDVSLTIVVNQMSSVLSTVADRSDQKVIVHFDPEYLQSQTKYKNYSLKEVVDMRGLFVYTTFHDVIISSVVGVMKDFDGDGLTVNAKKLKKDFVEEYYAPIIEPKPWNKIHALKKKYVGIICMRIRLDSQLMYSRNISMVTVINGLSKSINLGFSVCGSSLQDGIIDILAKLDTSLEETAGTETSNFAYTVAAMDKIKRNFNTIAISGLPKVSSMVLERVDMVKLLISYKKPEEYYVSNLGMQLWMQHNSLDLTWKEIEYNMSLVTEDTLENIQSIETVFILGNINDRVCVYVQDMPPGSIEDAIIPTEDQMTKLYIEYYCKKRSSEVTNILYDELWVIQLDAISMKIKCVDSKLIEILLEYCGVEVVGFERSRTSELIEYVYVKSAENPKNLVERHFNPKLYTKENISFEFKTPLSNNAIIEVNKLLEGKKENLAEGILTHIEVEFLNRISKYYYAVLNVGKKGQGKEKGPIVEHVVSHVYSEIIRYPFVSREKTTCNDWHTMNYVLGSDAARNNYIMEPAELFRSCDIKMDPRHLELLGDYVFERGTASGIGLNALARHGVGIMHEISIKKPYQQLATAHLRESESAAHYATSTPMGTAPIGIGTKEREVEQFRKMEEMARSTMYLRYGKTKNVSVVGKLHAENSDAVNLAVRSTLIDADPYYGIHTFSLKQAKIPQYSSEFRPAGEGGIEKSISYSFKILEEVKSTIELETMYERLKMYREYTGHIKKIVQLDMLTSNIIDMDQLYAFFNKNTSIFT